MTDLHDHSPGGDLVFPGDLDGTEFRLRTTTLHDAEEGISLPGVDGSPEYGRWLYVDTHEAEQQLMSAPGELIQELQRLEASEGDPFVVTRCEKSGPDQSDPYEVNLEALEEEQARL